MTQQPRLFVLGGTIPEAATASAFESLATEQVQLVGALVAAGYDEVQDGQYRNWFVCDDAVSANDVSIKIVKSGSAAPAGGTKIGSGPLRFPPGYEEAYDIYAVT